MNDIAWIIICLLAALLAALFLLVVVTEANETLADENQRLRRDLAKQQHPSRRPVRVVR